MAIPLRIAVATGQHRRLLRRYTAASAPDCPGGYHNAGIDLGEIGVSAFGPGDGPRLVTADDWPHDDPRWPARCDACPYEFTPGDQWQRSNREIYRLPDGAEFTYSRSFGQVAPPGTMIRIPWYDEYAAADGRPGESWLVSLPDGGDWITTQRATGGGHWEVTGTAPAITVHPSIWHNSPNGWHGWIRNGELVDA